jgi:hypothetical protein
MKAFTKLVPCALLLACACMAVRATNILIPTTVSGLTYSASGNTIPGTPTDTYLLANYPAASYSGYTANTSDMGTETSDGTRWIFGSDFPVPAAAAALGYTKRLYAFHPIVSDIALDPSLPQSTYPLAAASPGGNSSRHASFTGTISGVTLTATSITGTMELDQVVQCAGCTYDTKIVSGSSGTWTVSLSQSVGPVAMTSGHFFTGSNGQFTMTGGRNHAGSIMAASSFNFGLPYADYATTLPYLPASAGYYMEDATTVTTNVYDNWAAPLWMWTVEDMADNHTTNWVENDILEWGFKKSPNGNTATAFGPATTLHGWEAGNVDKQAGPTYGTATYLETDEHIAGGAWNPTAGTPYIQGWLDGTSNGTLNFSAVTVPIDSTYYSGKHHFPIIDAASFGYTGIASFTGTISNGSGGAGTQLAVSAVTGTIYIGTAVVGPGIAPLTRITAGTTSPYTVSISQNVGSEAMTSTNQYDLSVRYISAFVLP